MKDNKGYSLIEVLVTVFMISVLSSVLVASLSGLFSSEAQGTAKNINTRLSMCKTQAMSRAGDVAIVIYRNASRQAVCDYYEGGVHVSTEVLGSSHGVLSYTDSVGAAHSLEEGERLYISFYRNTGALKTIAEAASAAGVSSVNTAHCEKITVSSGSRDYVITLVASTGKHTLGGG